MVDQVLLKSVMQARVFGRVVRIALCFTMSALVVPQTIASEPAAREGRLIATFEGIECEYAPEREDLARAIAQRLAIRNQKIAAAMETSPADASPLVPASAIEMRANREAYLAGIAALIGLKKATPLQEECYDEFLNNYDRTMQLYEELTGFIQTMQIVKRVSVWDRADLVDRLMNNEKIPGFSYDAATKKGGVTYGMSRQGTNDKFKKINEEREKLHLHYKFNFSKSSTGTKFSAGFAPPKKVSEKSTTTLDAESKQANAEPKRDQTEWLPVIIPTELADESTNALADMLWDGAEGHNLVKFLDGLTQARKVTPNHIPEIAFILLHETTEVGIVENYYQGKDRRWFCDGMANYVSWRVVRDLYGTTTADTVYNLDQQLKRYEPYRSQIDLRKWSAVEDQSEENKGTELNSARYAYAARAVFLMTERGGEDVLPKLFAEIGRTAPKKVSYKTVEKAWKKVTGKRLDSILSAAVQPQPKS